MKKCKNINCERHRKWQNKKRPIYNTDCDYYNDLKECPVLAKEPETASPYLPNAVTVPKEAEKSSKYEHKDLMEDWKKLNDKDIGWFAMVESLLRKIIKRLPE